MAWRQLISIQSQIWRSTGVRVASNAIKQKDFCVGLEDEYEQLAVDSAVAVLRATAAQVVMLERAVLAVMKPRPEYQILQTMRGVVKYWD